MLAVVVRLPGPPAVRIWIVSNVLNASIPRRKAAVSSSGRSSGRTTKRKICHPPAPSTMAASTGSAGIGRRPAERKKDIKRGHFTHAPGINREGTHGGGERFHRKL